VKVRAFSEPNSSVIQIQELTGEFLYGIPYWTIQEQSRVFAANKPFRGRFRSGRSLSNLRAYRLGGTSAKEQILSGSQAQNQPDNRELSFDGLGGGVGLKLSEAGLQISDSGHAPDRDGL
jgi:hypothetical protein